MKCEICGKDIAKPFEKGYMKDETHGCGPNEADPDFGYSQEKCLECIVNDRTEKQLADIINWSEISAKCSIITVILTVIVICIMVIK